VAIGTAQVVEKIQLPYDHSQYSIIDLVKYLYIILCNGIFSHVIFSQRGKAMVLFNLKGAIEILHAYSIYICFLYNCLCVFYIYLKQTVQSASIEFKGLILYIK